MASLVLSLQPVYAGPLLSVFERHHSIVTTYPIGFLGARSGRGVALETEKCSVCGASVKKENLRGHYDRVHPKRSGSLKAESKTVTYSRQGSIFRRSHRRRNLLVISLVALAVIGVCFVAASYDRGVHWHPNLSLTLNGSPYTVPGR